MTVTASDGVEASVTETIEVTAPKNRYAVITDTRDDDTGELRYAPMDSIRNGRITFMYRVAEGPGIEGPNMSDGKRAMDVVCAIRESNGNKMIDISLG